LKKQKNGHRNIGHFIIQPSFEWHQLSDAYLDHVIILSDRGHLEQRCVEDHDDEFDWQWHTQPAVDPLLQVLAVHQQDGDSDGRHRGGRPDDGMETVEEVVERVRYLHHAVPPSHVHDQQFFQLKSENDDGYERGEATDVPDNTVLSNPSRKM